MVTVFTEQTIERYRMARLAVKEKTVHDYLLTAGDRCDACGAQAYVAATGDSGELMFCAHHWNKIMSDPNGYVSMMAFAKDIVDERERAEVR